MASNWIKLSEKFIFQKTWRLFVSEFFSSPSLSDCCVGEFVEVEFSKEKNHVVLLNLCKRINHSPIVPYSTSLIIGITSVMNIFSAAISNFI